MSASFAPAAVAALKSITIRLSTTQPDHLPRVAAQSSKLLWDCRELLSTPADVLKTHSEVSVLVHKFRTHLSTLLQDRTIEGRWAAVVLTKAALEAGGVETLSKSNAWVRPLLGILKKPEPPTTRILTILTLTRVFMLTWDHTNLVREITTPALPAYISTCLINANHPRCSPRELETILESFAMLIARHPTIFRTHEAQIRALLLSILSPASNGHEQYSSQSLQDVARRLLILLHHCAPKQGGAEKWKQLLHSTIQAAHATCDRVARSLVSEWQSTAGVQPSVPSNQLVSGEVELEHDEQLELKGWKGIDAGAERLISLLDLISLQLEAPTSTSVSVAIGHTIDLISRICSTVASLKAHHEVSREEREAFVLVLPYIHAAAIRLSSTLVLRFGSILTSSVPSLLAAVRNVTSDEFEHVIVRHTTYDFLRVTVSLLGPSMTRIDVAEIEAIIKACCEDLLVEGDQLQTSKSHVPFIHSSTKLGGNSYAVESGCNTDLARIASGLLPVLLAKIHPAMLSARIRIQMDRTAVLTRNKDAMVASVLNPTRDSSGKGTQASLLPLLAREFPTCPEVEALVRPRMPIIRTGVTVDAAEGRDEESDMEVDQYGAREGDIDDSVTNAVPSLQLPVDEERAGSDITLDDLQKNDFAPEKRSAVDESPSLTTRHSKRLRASPPANSEETLLPVDDSTTPQVKRSGPTASSAEQPPPSSGAATYTTAASQQTLNATSVDHVPSTSFSDPSAIEEIDEDEGSDFEMPPLTMEQDTASEGEDET